MAPFSRRVKISKSHEHSSSSPPGTETATKKIYEDLAVYIWSTWGDLAAIDAQSASVGPARCDTCAEVSRWSTRGIGTWQFLSVLTSWLSESVCLDCLHCSCHCLQEVFLSASLIQFVLRWGLHRWKPILRYSLRLAKLTLKNVSFYLESWRDPWWVACYSLLGTLWESITYCNINILQSHHTTRHRRPRRHLTRWKWM